MPLISETVNRRRIEKLRRTRAEDPSDETLSILTRSGDKAAETVSSREIAADMMGVSEGYVGHAKRIKEQSPPLFEQVRTGEISIPEALRRLDQTPDDSLGCPAAGNGRSAPYHDADFLRRLPGACGLRRSRRQKNARDGRRSRRRRGATAVPAASLEPAVSAGPLVAHCFKTATKNKIFGEASP